jgi:hypothetical protein
MSTTNKEYDVYYSTGGGSLVGGGADVWVNHWIEEIAPKLKVTPKLMIHRNKPIVNWTEEKHKNFKKRVDRGEQGNSGRQVHKKIEKTFKDTAKKIDKTPPEIKKRTYKDVLKTELKHYWQGDNPEEFGEILNGARRIHILHGYYHPHKYIRDNKDKIYTNAVHCNVSSALKASFLLSLKTGFNFAMSPNWETEIVGYAKNSFWIGVDKPNLDNEHNDKILHIPNFYEFRRNYDVTDNNTVGFASRCETRKCPHFLAGIDSEFFTDPKDVKWWRRNIGTDTSKWKVFTFKWENIERFYHREWGISHSAHIVEPFGYSIFQAIDYGKVPILAGDWLTEYEYPFRASNPVEFREQYKKLCEVSLDGRRNLLWPLREYLTEKFDNKEEWTEKMLKLYNE